MKIFIENYKNIRNVTLDVPESKRMILLGANGTGKTNTLEAIYYEKCSFLDCEDEYADRFLLSLDHKSMDYYYPNADLIRELFSFDDEKDLISVLMEFLEKSYDKLKMPLMRKLINDALDAFRFARINKKFDPSPLAITRLVILNRIYEKARQLNQKYIILMDTPELYAHPLLMEEISTSLLKLEQAGCLVIVTTHNEQVISRLFTRFNEIVRLSKNAEGFMETMTVDMEKVEKDIIAFYEVDEYLTHNFSKSSRPDFGLVRLLERDIEGYLITAFRDRIIKAFFYNTIVLGEGASEDVLFDYIENKVHPSWAAEYRVGFMNCMGKSTMPLYFIFLNNIGVKTFVIYDYDNDNNPVHVAYREAFNRYFHDHKNIFRCYYLKPDLEGFLNIGERVESIIKPVNIYNYTFMQDTRSKGINRLLNVLKENIISLNKETE